MPLHDAGQYVFVDESGVTTDLLRRYARSLRGTRVSDHTPCGHWQTHTVVAALRPRPRGALRLRLMDNLETRRSFERVARALVRAA